MDRPWAQVRSLGHLPDRLDARVRNALLQRAYDSADVGQARAQLERLARELEREHPGAAAPLREGLEERLTLQRLGLRGALYRLLRSTNAIENLNGVRSRLIPTRTGKGNPRC